MKQSSTVNTKSVQSDKVFTEQLSKKFYLESSDKELFEFLKRSSKGGVKFYG